MERTEVSFILGIGSFVLIFLGSFLVLSSKGRATPRRIAAIFVVTIPPAIAPAFLVAARDPEILTAAVAMTAALLSIPVILYLSERRP